MTLVMLDIGKEIREPGRDLVDARLGQNELLCDEGIQHGLRGIGE